MTPTLLDLALKAGFSDPIEGWMGEAYEERLEAFAKLIIDYEIAAKIAKVTGELTDEPVAWATMLGSYSHVSWGKDRPDYPIRYEVPLYTHPHPAEFVCSTGLCRYRKPLTDEEVQFIYADTGYNDIQMFARAIEAAHGITGE